MYNNKEDNSPLKGLIFNLEDILNCAFSKCLAGKNTDGNIDGFLKKCPKYHNLAKNALSGTQH